MISYLECKALACAKTRNTETPRNTINNKVSGNRVLKTELTVPFIGQGIDYSHFPGGEQVRIIFL